MAKIKILKNNGKLITDGGSVMRNVIYDEYHYSKDEGKSWNTLLSENWSVEEQYSTDNTDADVSVNSLGINPFAQTNGQDSGDIAYITIRLTHNIPNSSVYIDLNYTNTSADILAIYDGNNILKSYSEGSGSDIINDTLDSNYLDFKCSVSDYEEFVMRTASFNSIRYIDIVELPI